jgi:hypothetical protein
MEVEEGKMTSRTLKIDIRQSNMETHINLCLLKKKNIFQSQKHFFNPLTEKKIISLDVAFIRSFE